MAGGTTRPDDAIRAALRASAAPDEPFFYRDRATAGGFAGGRGMRRGASFSARRVRLSPRGQRRGRDDAARRRRWLGLLRPGGRPPKEKERGENPDGPNLIADEDDDQCTGDVRRRWRPAAGEKHEVVTERWPQAGRFDKKNNLADRLSSLIEDRISALGRED